MYIDIEYQMQYIRPNGKIINKKILLCYINLSKIKWNIYLIFEITEECWYTNNRKRKKKTPKNSLPRIYKMYIIYIIMPCAFLWSLFYYCIVYFLFFFSIFVFPFSLIKYFHQKGDCLEVTSFSLYCQLWCWCSFIITDIIE